MRHTLGGCAISRTADVLVIGGGVIGVCCAFARRPNIYVAAGHAMFGYTMAPITGKLISEMITGRPLSLAPEPLRLGRFF